MASLFRSAELRFMVAGLVAVGSLAMGLLTIIATRTDALMVDLAAWRPVVPADHPEMARAFADAQRVPATRRPFRLTLELPPGRSGLSTMAAERTFHGLTGACYDFGVNRWSPSASPGVVEVIFVNDRVAWMAAAGGPGEAIAIEDIRPRAGAIQVRLALTRAQADGAAALVHFEYATLRQCRPRAPAAARLFDDGFESGVLPGSWSGSTPDEPGSSRSAPSVPPK